MSNILDRCVGCIAGSVLNSLKLMLFLGCLTLGWIRIAWLSYIWFYDSYYSEGLPETLFSARIYIHLVIMIMIAFYGSYVTVFSSNTHIKVVSTVLECKISFARNII